MSYADLDEFVTTQTLLVKDAFRRRFKTELTTVEEQAISDHLWFVLTPHIKEEK